jgi:hypothetical protein
MTKDEHRSRRTRSGRSHSDRSHSERTRSERTRSDGSRSGRSLIDRLQARDLTRREFLHRSAAIGAGAALASTGLLPDPLAAGEREAFVPRIDLAVAKGGSPARNFLAAIEALGGFDRFVHDGDKVVISRIRSATRPSGRSIRSYRDGDRVPARRRARGVA